MGLFKKHRLELIAYTDSETIIYTNFGVFLIKGCKKLYFQVLVFSKNIKFVFSAEQKYEFRVMIFGII